MDIGGTEAEVWTSGAGRFKRVGERPCDVSGWVATRFANCKQDALHAQATRPLARRATPRGGPRGAPAC
eukprot:5386645-Prymnesium_polylepis.1